MMFPAVFETIRAKKLRRRALKLAGRIAAPVVLRLFIGDWIKPQGRKWFAAGFAEQTITLPPLMRGLLALPAGRHMLRVAATYAWHQDRGSLDFAGPPDLGGDLYTAWTGPKLGFLHFEKSGGIAVMRWLSGKFHPTQINPDDHRDLPPHLCYRTPAFAGLDTGRFPMIWGHYDLPTLQRFGPAHLIFTVLREPRARLLSLYQFWHSVDPARIDPDLSFSVALAHRLSLEAFLASDDPLLVDLTDNVYTRRLSGLYATGAAADPLRTAPEAALQKAIRALDTLGFVGVTERLDESLACFAGKLGLAPPGASIRANVTAENFADPSGWFRAVPRAPQTPAVEALLDRRTRLDRALYAHALARAANQAVAAE
jgi:hypothetical protein